MKKKPRKDDTGAYLRQWNEELKAELKQCVKAYEMKVAECKELRNLCNAYEKEHNTTFKKWQKDMEIIDKAIEYINEFESIKAYFEYTDEDGYDEYDYDDEFRNELLNILKGDSDEKGI